MTNLSSTSKIMLTLYVALGFIILFFVFIYFFPAKTEDKITWDKDEKIIFRTQPLTILNRPDVGKSRNYPASQLLFSNKRILFLQKTLIKGDMVVIEAFVNENNPPEEWQNIKIWGNVPIYKVNKNSVSLKQNILTLESFGGIISHTLTVKELPEAEAFAQHLAQWQAALSE
ncbi:MAG: hypothetical protein JJT94_13325 [Bernardetiaceae bacterium]|nr:hypothetical protein [Bernardetiaceae bacterium]